MAATNLNSHSFLPVASIPIHAPHFEQRNSVRNSLHREYSISLTSHYFNNHDPNLGGGPPVAAPWKYSLPQ
jgi:hypothetical protein